MSKTKNGKGQEYRMAVAHAALVRHIERFIAIATRNGKKVRVKIHYR